MKVTIFIDYDNLSNQQKEKGVKSVIQQVLCFIDNVDSLEKRGDCLVRLYGGWYEEDVLTPDAEKLISEVDNHFSTIIKMSTIQFNTKVELAYAMVETPQNHIFRTFRKKQFPYNIRCSSPSTLGCSDNDCPLKILKKFIKNKRCTKDGCTVDVSDFMYRNEQKLVDTMLTCDILYSHKMTLSAYIYVVSSDDDLLPAIKTLAYRGMNVTRVYTKLTETTDRNEYKERSLS